jgi:hypothetical protein
LAPQSQSEKKTQIFFSQNNHIRTVYTKYCDGPFLKIWKYCPYFEEHTELEDVCVSPGIEQRLNRLHQLQNNCTKKPALGETL